MQIDYPVPRPSEAAGPTARVRVRRSRLAAVAAAELELVVVASVYAVVATLALPQALVQDGWLTLVSGREIAAHGLPSTDWLTVWTEGRVWVDQQWLAQIVFYGLHVLGGIGLVMLVHALLLVTACVLALIAARRLGASTKATWLVAAASLLVAPWSLQMRAQSFALPLFVLVLWLLCADSQRRSARVVLVVPLLAVWANVHGTVVLGATLVGLHVLVELARAARAPRAPRLAARAALLGAGAAGAVFASPYGLDLVGYYRSLLLNPSLTWFIDEWGASTPSQKTFLFYVLACVTIWLAARHRSRLTGFEQAALGLLGLSGILAIRSIVWFGLAAVVLGPRLLDPVLGQSSARRAGARAGLALAAVLSAAAVVAGAALQPPSWYEGQWPRAGARVAATLAAAKPGVRVFSDDRYANWLMWTEPSLVGRIAHDVRFELFTPTQFVTLYAFRNQVGDDWRAAAAGYDVVAIDHSQQPALEAALLADGLRPAHRDERLVVLRRR